MNPSDKVLYFNAARELYNRGADALLELYPERKTPEEQLAILQDYHNTISRMTYLGHEKDKQSMLDKLTKKINELKQNIPAGTQEPALEQLVA